MKDELPSSWAFARLPELIDCDGIFIDGDWVESKDQDPDGDVRLIQLADIGDGVFVNKSNRFLTHQRAVDLNCTFLESGDVLVARMPDPLGRACIFPGDKRKAVTVVDVCVIRAREHHVDSLLLKHFINAPTFREGIDALQSGSTRKRISRGNLSTLKLPVPPRAEQTRIVDKLEELLSDLDAGVAELKAAQKKLAQYRQSLLKAAVEGRLTEAWRAQHGEPEESGAQLLARILRERRARWEAKQLAKFEAQGKAPIKGWQEKYADPVTPNETELPSLPRGWVWASADQLTAECSYGTSVKCSYEGNGTPVLRIPNVARRELDFGDLKFASEPLHLDAPDYLAQGDVLVVRTNGSIGLVGRAAAIESPLGDAFYFASYLLRLRAVERTVIPSWISAFLGSSAGRAWVEKRAASSAGQHNISLSTLLTLPIPLPPIVEQREALATVRAAFEVAAVSESDTATVLRQSTAQRKNVLQAAFSGQLVPQDPNDQPASVLLASIRAERAAVAAIGTRRGRRVGTAL